MNKLRLVLLFLLLAPFAAFGDSSTTGGARVIENPTSNGDLKMRVNVGGTKVDALAITGSTGVTSIGNSAGNGTNVHTLYGSTLGRITSSGTSFSLFSPTDLDLNANAYRADTGVSKAFSTVTGYTNLTLSRVTTSSGTVFGLYSDYQDAQTAGLNVVATNQKTIMTGTAAGAWNLGDSAGGQSHNFYGNLSIDNHGSGGGNASLTINAKTSSIPFIGLSVNGSSAWSIGQPSSGTFEIANSGSFGTSTRISIDSGGIVSMPSGSKFKASGNGSDTISFFKRLLNDTSTIAYSTTAGGSPSFSVNPSLTIDISRIGNNVTINGRLNPGTFSSTGPTRIDFTLPSWLTSSRQASSLVTGQGADLMQVYVNSGSTTLSFYSYTTALAARNFVTGTVADFSLSYVCAD